MADDSTAPATKGDLTVVTTGMSLLKDALQSIHESMKSMQQDMRIIFERLVKLEVRVDEMKDELKEELMVEIDKKFEAKTGEIKQHFDVVAENMRHDLVKGALHDKVQQHEDRIYKLEKQVVRT